MSTQKKSLIVFGFGGHARSVADVAVAAGFNELMFIEENGREGEDFVGFPVRKTVDGLSRSDWLCISASGDNCNRQKQLNSAIRDGWTITTLIAPSATIGLGAVIGRGCLIGHHAHVGPMARVGDGCIINTSSVVEHECVIGDYVHAAVNSTVAGRSQLGDFVFLGAGATVIDRIIIASGIIIGANSVVVSSLTEQGTYVGVPVKIILKGY
jgi:UDP-N-acetylbacillosamine N-acetyltransferase